jgi:hypothetical protein
VSDTSAPQAKEKTTQDQLACLRASRVGESREARSEAVGHPRNAMEPFRCHGCGEVIGVYEPLVVEGSHGARATSRAAEADLRTSATAHYHRECYAASQTAPRQSATIQATVGQDAG